MNTVDSVDITVDIILLREAAGGGRYRGGVAALRFSAESFKWSSIIFSQTIRNIYSVLCNCGLIYTQLQ